VLLCNECDSDLLVWDQVQVVDRLVRCSGHDHDSRTRLSREHSRRIRRGQGAWMYAVCRGTGRSWWSGGTCETLGYLSCTPRPVVLVLVLVLVLLLNSRLHGRIHTLNASRLVQIVRNKYSGPHTLDSAPASTSQNTAIKPWSPLPFRLQDIVSRSIISLSLAQV
jgi:hypothetical protein